MDSYEVMNRFVDGLLTHRVVRGISVVLGMYWLVGVVGFLADPMVASNLSGRMPNTSALLILASAAPFLLLSLGMILRSKIAYQINYFLVSLVFFFGVIALGLALVSLVVPVWFHATGLTVFSVLMIAALGLAKWILGRPPVKEYFGASGRPSQINPPSLGYRVQEGYDEDYLTSPSVISS